LDYDKLYDILYNVAGRVVARELLNRFYVQFGLTTDIFKAIACDCTNSGVSDCFGAPIETKLAACSVDPSSRSACSGFAVGTDTFANGTAISIDVKQVSSASFLGMHCLIKKEAAESL
jgi:hypothetical protein